MSPSAGARIMVKSDSQQRGLAGEYYVAFIISRLGYDIAITVGRAKRFDMVALASSGETVKIQVKSTRSYGDWLVPGKFDSSRNSVVALVRLGKDNTQRPELYLVPGAKANGLVNREYPTHSPRINRAKVRAKFQDHDLALIESLLAGVEEGRSPS